jgi:hypothetical protein
MQPAALKPVLADEPTALDPRYWLEPQAFWISALKTPECCSDYAFCSISVLRELRLTSQDVN